VAGAPPPAPFEISDADGPELDLTATVHAAFKTQEPQQPPFPAPAPVLPPAAVHPPAIVFEPPFEPPPPLPPKSNPERTRALTLPDVLVPPPPRAVTPAPAIEKFAARDNNDVEGGHWFVASKQFARQALGAVANDRAANLAGRRNAKPRKPAGCVIDEDRHQPPVHLDARPVNCFELGPTPDVFARTKRHRSSDTVRRLRPLARRRLMTCWPSLVAMRTKKPCVFLRRRLFG
jgi:hypothetical protein